MSMDDHVAMHNINLAGWFIASHVNYKYHISRVVNKYTLV